MAQEEMSQKEILSYIIKESSASVAIIAPRGSGKSQLIGTLSYALWRNGWHVIVFDPKGAFQYINLRNVADPKIANKVADYWGIDYPMPDFKFYMPYYAWDFKDVIVPDYIELAPISLKMISYNPNLWSLITADKFIRSKDVESLQNAYIMTGRDSTNLDKIKNYFKGKNPSQRLLNFLFSGILGDTSPLEAENLFGSPFMKEPSKNYYTVLTSPVTTNPGVIAFWYGAFIAYLYQILRTWPKHINIAIFIDESLVLSSGVRTTATSWWFGLWLSNFLSQMRQVGVFGNVRTRIFLSSQLSTGVPYDVIGQFHLLFVHPATLAKDDERRYLKSKFSKEVKPINVSNPPPGTFAIFDPHKFYGIYEFPPSPLFIPKEYAATEEEGRKMQDKFILRHVNYKSLLPLYSKADEELRLALSKMMKLKEKAPPPEEPSQDLSDTVTYYLWKNQPVLVLAGGAAQLIDEKRIGPEAVVPRSTLWEAFVRRIGFNEPSAAEYMIIWAKKDCTPIHMQRSSILKSLKALGLEVEGSQDYAIRVTSEFFRIFESHINLFSPDSLRNLVVSKYGENSYVAMALQLVGFPSARSEGERGGEGNDSD